MKCTEQTPVRGVSRWNRHSGENNEFNSTFMEFQTGRKLDSNLYVIATPARNQCSPGNLFQISISIGSHPSHPKSYVASAIPGNSRPMSPTPLGGAGQPKQWRTDPMPEEIQHFIGGRRVA